MAILRVVTIVLGVAGSAAALPKAEPYDEVIPGPGMPSLESLGLTTRDLYEMALVDSSLEKRDFPTCASPDSTQRCRNVDAQACINYLANKGNTACGVHPQAVFCQAGACQIQGSVARSAPVGTKDASSACSTVASVAQRIISSCNFASNTTTQGTGSPDNNQNLVVQIIKP